MLFAQVEYPRKQPGDGLAQLGDEVGNRAEVWGAVAWEGDKDDLFTTSHGDATIGNNATGLRQTARPSTAAQAVRLARRSHHCGSGRQSRLGQAYNTGHQLLL